MVHTVLFQETLGMIWLDLSTYSCDPVYIQLGLKSGQVVGFASGKHV